MATIQIKRVYLPAEASDGYRILVDRLWPRGISREQAAIKEWAKNVAPSTELREWFGHDPDKFDEFRRRYLAELDHNPTLDHLRDVARQEKRLTLIYAAKDTEHNEAVVLRDLLEK